MIEEVKYIEPTEKQKDKRTYKFLLGLHIVGMINGGCFSAMVYSVYFNEYLWAVFFLLFFLGTLPPSPKIMYKRNQMLKQK